jgi:Fe-S-cluster containining protein
MKQNTWYAKIKRTFGAFLPVAKNRQGECQRCGACCHLPVRCWFLKQRADGTQYCAIYRFRPLNCRKYPRTEQEHITKSSCGFYFDIPQTAVSKQETLVPQTQSIYPEIGK